MTSWLLRQSTVVHMYRFSFYSENVLITGSQPCPLSAQSCSLEGASAQPGLCRDSSSSSSLGLPQVHTRGEVLR